MRCCANIPGSRAACAVLLLALVVLAGCHSPYINVIVENRTGGPIGPVEVDYPSASFGIPVLGSGATYKYRFKVLGSGGTKVLWTDSGQHEHTYSGPPLHEGQEGFLKIVLAPSSATWTPTLQP